MKDMANNWIKWWNRENVVTPDIWFNNMDTFITASDLLLHYNSQDIILDIGCGPGYLADFLKDKVKEIHCLDTSQRYLDMCTAKFSGYNNLFFYKLPENNYLDISFLKGKRFSIIICQSVIQYYKDSDEVKNLITEVQRIAWPGTRFLIADIPITTSMALHVYGLLKGACRKKRLLEISKMLLHMVTNENDRKAYLSLGLLTFSGDELNRLISRLNLDAEVLHNRLTVNENRRHILIRF
jgi:ubiquinone/menaquinone biosynthesis C-methylase UbiE